jgi:hypothetical protein
MISRLSVVGCLLLVTAVTSAQENPYTPTTPLPLGDVLLTLPTSHMASKGTWEVRFTHRFNQSLDQGSFSDRVHSLFGLDSNADVGLGLSYVPRRDVQFSVYLSNALDDIEVGGRYLVVQQAPAIPFSAAIRVGGDWRTERDSTDRTSLFAQAIVSRRIGHAELFALPTYVTNAGRAVSGNTSTAHFTHATNVPVGMAFMLHDGFTVIGVVIPKNRDLPQGTRTDFGWAVGIKQAIGLH